MPNCPLPPDYIAAGWMSFDTTAPLLPHEIDAGWEAFHTNVAELGILEGKKSYTSAEMQAASRGKKPGPVEIIWTESVLQNNSPIVEETRLATKNLYGPLLSGNNGSVN